jgi:isopenicillin-N N-acyltransferase like protein
VTEPFRHVRVRGGPRERGVAYGEEARERVRRSVDAYRDVFRADAGWEWPQVTEHAMGYRDAIERFDPRYLEEIKGIATGAGLATEDILAINVRTEVMFAAKARQATEQSRRPGECTAFAVTPERSADGHTLLGQNWDWLPHAEETVVVLEVAQDEEPDYVTVVEAGLLAKTGMNAAGIGLVTNALVSDADRGLAGVPYHVALRAILDSRSISDATRRSSAGSVRRRRTTSWPTRTGSPSISRVRPATSTTSSSRSRATGWCCTRTTSCRRGSAVATLACG